MKARLLLSRVAMSLLIFVSMGLHVHAQIFVTSPNTSSIIQQCSSLTLYYGSPISYCTAELWKGSSLLQTQSSVPQGTNYSWSTNGLAVGSDYRIKVIDPYNYSTNFGWSQTFTIGPVDAPAAIAASSVSNNSFSVNWNAVTGATDYRIDVATDVNFTSMVPGYNNVLASSLTGGGTSRAIYSGLSYGTVYYYRVRTVRNSCVSPNSNVISVLTVPSPAIAPLSEVNSTQFYASWPAVTGALDYTVEISTSSSFASFTSQVITSTSVLKTGLPANTPHYIRVRARHAAGHSTYSNVRTADLIAPPTADAATSVGVSWFTANYSGPSFTGFYIDVSTSGSFTSFVLMYNNYWVGTQLSTAILSLAPGTTYHYRVRGRTPAGNTTTNSNVRSVPTLPVAPVLAPLTELSYTQFRAGWQAVAGADSYDVNMSENAAFNGSFGQSVATTFYLSTNLSSPYERYIRVRARNASGTSSWSNVKFVNLKPPPGAGSSGNRTTSSFVAGYWFYKTTPPYPYIDVSTVSDFTSFVGNYNNFPTTSASSQEITGLSPNTTYYYRLRGITEEGSTTINSNVGSGLTCPLGPTVAPVTEISTNSFTVYWTPVTGIEYRIYNTTSPNPISPDNTWYNALPVPAGSSSFVVSSSIYPATVYYCHVIASNGGTCRASTAVVVNTRPTKPVITGISGRVRGFEVCWNVQGNVNQYYIDVATDANFNNIVQNNISVISGNCYTVGNLSPLATYYCRVTAMNSLGLLSEDSDASSVIPMTDPPVAIEATEVSLANGKFTSNWNPVPSSTYQMNILRKDPQSCSVTSSIPVINMPNNWYTYNVPSGSVFFYHVYSKDPYNRVSGASNEVAVVLGNYAPTLGAPTNITSNSFTVNWNPVSSSLGYRLDVSTNATFSSYVSGYQNKSVTGTSHVVNQGLVAGTTYYFRVRARVTFPSTPCVPAGSTGVSTSSSTGTAATTCSGCRTGSINEDEVNLTFDEPSMDGQMVVYPNPVFDVLHVPLPLGYDRNSTELRLYQSSGRKMTAPVDWYATGAEVDVSSFANGLYLIQVYRDGRTVVHKFLKQ